MLLATLTAALAAGGAAAVLGGCGPFLDVSDPAFCPFVLEIFDLGITTGTTPTTYAPSDPVSRLQMAAFLSRSVDSVLLRNSRRAALGQFWTPQGPGSLGITTVGSTSGAVFGPACDGTDVWVTQGPQVLRYRGSDARLLETWTGMSGTIGAMTAMGKVFPFSSSTIYRISPDQPAGAAEIVASQLPFVHSMTFDGSRLWTANGVVTGSVSIVTPSPAIPWTVTTVTAGFPRPVGVLFDGANVWATEAAGGTLLRLDPSGAILQTVTVGTDPTIPVFDGTNIFVPNSTSNSVTVVRASSGAVLATLTGNGLMRPFFAAFDGIRVMVTNFLGDGVSVWKASDLSSLGFVSTGAGSTPTDLCSDGLSFWIALSGSDALARF